MRKRIKDNSSKTDTTGINIDNNKSQIRRKRKSQTVSNGSAEYLTKMSVRGLDLDQYMLQHDGIIRCGECEKQNIFKTFKNKYSFQRHAYLFHEGKNRKVFPCTICGKEFSRPDKMKIHKKDKHDGEDDETFEKTLVENEKKEKKILDKIRTLIKIEEQTKVETSNRNSSSNNIQPIVTAQNSTPTVIITSNSNPPQIIETHQIDFSNAIIQNGNELIRAHHIQNTNGMLSNTIEINSAMLQEHHSHMQPQNIVLQTNGTLLQNHHIQISNDLLQHQRQQQQQQQQHQQQHQQHQQHQQQQHQQQHQQQQQQQQHQQQQQQHHHQQQQQHQHQHQQQHQLNQNSIFQTSSHGDTILNDVTTFTKLENVNYIPNESHVIGTVQSYQILTPEGHLQNLTPKLETNEIELCPYTSYNFVSNDQQSQQLLEMKNDLIIKNDQFIDSSMYLPFSPSSMINAVNDVNNSSMLESKEISYDITEAVLLAL